jgi:hypothetical protein
MSAAFVQAIDDLLGFVQDKRPPECFVLHSELLRQFDELDRKVWVEAHRAGMEDKLPRPATAGRWDYLGKTNLPGTVYQGFRVAPAYVIRSWRNDLLATRDLAAALNCGQDGAEQGLGAGPSGKRRMRRGRRPDTDPKADERVWDAWQSGGHQTHEQLAAALGKPKREVERALDRHRHRLKKHRKPAPE